MEMGTPTGGGEYEIFVKTNGHCHGPYSQEQVEQMLTTGEISINDLAWWEGSDSWVLLRCLLLDQPQIANFPSALAKQSIWNREYHFPQKVNDAVFCLTFFIGFILLSCLVGFLAGATPYREPSPRVKHFEREITQGIKAYDPSIVISPEEKRAIRRMAEEAAK